MLRKVVEHALIEKLDPDAPARSAEEGVEIARELVRQTPELAQYILPENQEAIEMRLAGQPVTVNTFREAIISLAALGALETPETLAQAQKIVEEKLRSKALREPARGPARDSAGRFTVDEDFRQQYNRMPAAEIKRRYFSDPEFRKKADILEGVSAPTPKTPTEEEPVTLTAEQWHSLPSHVVQRKMNNSAAFRAAIDRLTEERKI